MGFCTFSLQHSRTVNPKIKLAAVLKREIQSLCLCPCIALHHHNPRYDLISHGINPNDLRLKALRLHYLKYFNYQRSQSNQVWMETLQEIRNINLFLRAVIFGSWEGIMMAHRA